MLLKCFILLSFGLILSVKSFPQLNSFSPVNFVVDKGIFAKIWDSLTKMGRKFIDKITTLLHVLPFFQSSTRDHTMKIEDVAKQDLGVKEDFKGKALNMFNAMNSIFEVADKENLQRKNFIIK